MALAQGENPGRPRKSDTVRQGYLHLNLRFNPFGRLTPREEATVALPAVNAGAYAARLRRPGTAIQFLGPSGRGKTTHLMALHRYFPDAPYIYIARGAPVPPIPDAPILFLDEMQRVPRRRRRAILAQGASYVVGSHADHRREFANAQLDFATVRLCAVGPRRLQAILNRRIAFARRDPQRPVPAVTITAAQMLLDRCGADQWAMNNVLYDTFETLDHITALEQTLAANLTTYRMPWQRRLMNLDPAIASLVDFIVR